MELPPWLKDEGDSLLLLVKVQPRASRNAVDAAPGEELRIRLTAAPVDNAANEALLKFLAGKLECRRGQLALVRGQVSRHKAVRIHGIPPARVLRGLTGCPPPL